MKLNNIIFTIIICMYCNNYISDLKYLKFNKLKKNLILFFVNSIIIIELL